MKFLMNNCIVWNVQGIGMSISLMKKLAKKFEVSLVAVLELFHKEENMHRFAQSLAFTKCYTNEGHDGKF